MYALSLCLLYLLVFEFHYVVFHKEYEMSQLCYRIVARREALCSNRTGENVFQEQYFSRGGRSHR